MKVRQLSLIFIGTTFFAQLSLSEEHKQHSIGVMPKEEYVKAVPGVPDKVARMTILEIPPGREVDTHCHYGFEYGIVTQGTLLVKSGKADYQTKSAGEMFSVKPGTPMSVKNASEAHAQLYSLLIVDEHKPYVNYLDQPNECLNE
jgi:quercetin dioxygenase-like cupin family protein